MTVHRATVTTVIALAMAVAMAAGAWGDDALTRHDLGRTVKFKVVVDKVMQPEADWHTEQWMVQEAAEAGFNVFCPRRARDIEEVRQVTRWCEEAGILHIPWMRGTRGANLDDESADGKRMVWASGLEDRLWSPNSDEFWEWTNGLITQYAKISAEMPTLFGVFLDYENYALGANGYALSYDDTIMGRFARAQSIELPELALDERYPWLTEQGLHNEFERFQVTHWRERCRTLREAVDAIDPTFMFMIYPAPGTKFMVEACYPEWATEQAPLILADAVTYGRRSVLPHDQALRANRNALVERQRQAQASGMNLLYSGGIDPVVRGADPEFCGRNAAMISQVTDGYWIFYEGPEYEGTHEEYFRWFARANEAIDDRNWQWAWQQRQTPDTFGLEELVIEHPDRQQLIIHGAKSPFMQMLTGNEEYEVHEMAGIGLDYFADADVVVLQNFNQQLGRGAPFVRMLQEYVEQGGGLMLAHDTGWFMASPFPQIAVRGIPTQRVEAVRHVVETELVIEDEPHPAIRRMDPGTQFGTEFRDHMIFGPREAATVLARNEFGDPVYVAGEVGEGRVIFTGCYYGYDDPPSGAEAELFWHCVDWLAGEGPGYRRWHAPVDRGSARKWPERPMFR